MKYFLSILMLQITLSALAQTVSDVPNDQSRNIVTHTMLEVLAGVARMPHQYRALRRDVLNNDYEHVFDGCSHAYEAFSCLIGEIHPESLSKTGQACYRAALRLGGRQSD